MDIVCVIVQCNFLNKAEDFIIYIVVTLNLISKQCIVFNYVLNIVDVTVQYHLIKKAEDFIVHIVVTSRAATASSALKERRWQSATEPMRQVEKRIEVVVSY